MVHSIAVVFFVMGDKRTLVKRSGQIKVIKSMMEKGRLIIEDDTNDKGIKKEKELVAFVKNIRIKKTAIDELNKKILNTIEEEKIEEEILESAELDLQIDVELEQLESHLSALRLEADVEKKRISLTLFLRILGRALFKLKGVMREAKLVVVKLIVEKFKYGYPNSN